MKQILYVLFFITVFIPNNLLGAVNNNDDSTIVVDAVDDSNTTQINQSILIDVLANDSGQNISIKSVTQPEHGDANITDDKILYTPDSNYTGTDTFEYNISDTFNTDTATVTITVQDGDNPIFQNEYSCGIFDSVLVSYEHIQMGQNDVYNACEISVKDLNFDEDTSGVDVTCYQDEGDTPCTCVDSNDTDCSNDGTCTIVPEPKNRYDHTFIATSVTDSYTTYEDIEFTDLEYGNYNFTGNSGDNQQIYFNPQESYSDNDTKLMLLGDFEFAGNDQTLTFEAGDYYFNSFKIDRDGSGNINQVNICAKDDIRIFVHEDFVYSGNHLNDAGCGGKIFVYVEGDAKVDSNGGGSSDIPLFLYTEGDVTIESSGDSNAWVGAITAEGEIKVNDDTGTSNFNFIYDDSADAFGLGECQMCYTDIYVDGMSFSFMDCPGVDVDIGTKITVPIEATDTLTDVSVDETHGSAFGVDILGNQQVQDQDGNYIRDAESDSTSIGPVSIETGENTVIYPLGNENGTYGPTNENDYQQLYSSALMSFDVCSYDDDLVYTAHYNDGDKHYDTVLSKCTPDENNGGGIYISGPFDAWDTFRDNVSVPPTDRNISTKVVSAPFKLSLASLNYDNNAYETKAGEDSFINVAIYNYPELKPISNSYYFDANETAHISESDEFIVDRATPQAVVGFRLCATYDDSEHYYTLYSSSKCSGENHDCNATTNDDEPTWHICYSRDDFAIRPKGFTITASIENNISAGDDVNLTLRAIDNNGNPSTDYNETLALGDALSSPVLDYNITKSGCTTQTLTTVPSSVTFQNGEANITIKYSDVGDLNLTLHENQGTEFASIDSDDTDYNAQTDDTAESANTYDREIPLDSKVLGFIPDHFEVTATLEDFHRSDDVNFTYISSDLNMSSSLDINITAKNKDNETTVGYTDSCFAQPIDVNLTLTYSKTPDYLSKVYYLIKDREDEDRYYASRTDDAGVALSDNKIGHSIDTTAIFPTGDHNGTSYLEVKIGFDRKNNQPENPFELNASIAVKDINNVQEILKPQTKTATYIYARTVPSKVLYDDVLSNSIITPLAIETYCSKIAPSEAECPGTDILDGQTNDYRWWLSTAHQASNGDGNITLAVSIDTDEGEIENEFIYINNSDNGVDKNVTVQYAGTIRPYTVDIEIDSANSSSWLIYNPESDILAPTPLYSVRFIGNATWTGIGETGHVVGDTGNTKKTNRLDW